jgi:RHS repeat-associated protein
MAWTSTAARFRFFLTLLLSLRLLLGLTPGLAQTLPASEGLVADSTELRVLRQFYYATGGPQWNNHTNWLTGTTSVDFATWYNVQVAGGDVVGLSGYANNLRGTLPASLGELAQLVFLDLPANQLIGAIPARLGHLSRLQVLSLWQNRLSGSLPPELGQLTDLRLLSLAQNGTLSGPLPSALGQLRQLFHINLGSNQFSGTLPAELGQLTALTYLNLYDNKFSGPIPASLGQLVQLQQLALAVNKLTGPLPPELGQLGQLLNLQLWQNNFQDSIPAAWGGLRQLQALNGNQAGLLGRLPKALGQWQQLRGVSFYGNQLRGPVPAELTTLPELQTLNLEANQLSGPLPSQWSPALADLSLANNQLTGPVPAGLSRARGLVRLHLTSNQLSGTVPDSLGQLGALQELWLSNNRLNGPLPATLGRLTSLRSLNLEANQLTGTLPDSLGQLQHLSFLSVAGNQLRGSLAPLTGMASLDFVNAERNRLDEPLPTGLGALPNLSALYLTGNRLPGPLPTDLGQAPRLRQLLLSGNQLTGTVPANLLRNPGLGQLELGGNHLTAIEDLGGATGLPVIGGVTDNELDFANLERLYQGPGQSRFVGAWGAPAGLDARGQRPPSQVETVRYQAGGALTLRPAAAPAPHGYAYQWQRLVGGQWVNLPGDTLLTKTWPRATAAEQGTYRRVEHDRWFRDGRAAPTELYSASLYADMLPYAPLAQNRPDDTNQGLAIQPLLPADTLRTWHSTGQTDMNYVRVWTPRVALTDAAQVGRARIDSVSMSTQYLDGLGRPVQTVLKQASLAKRDMVQPQAYDGLGREPRAYLPYPDQKNGDGGYRPQALRQQDAFYRPDPRPNAPAPDDPTRGVARTGAAYAETVFENSPLNRVTAQGAPGETWQLSAGHIVERQERPNTATDSVLWFVPGYDPTSLDPGYRGYYAPGELWGTGVSDAHGPSTPGEPGYRTIEWKNKLGQVVCKQVEANRTGTNSTGLHSRWLRTCYVYDDFGRLRFVLQPEANKYLLASGPLAGAVTARVQPYLFHYRYDGRGRQIAKQVPGQDGETLVVYDQLNRPVLSQDAQQRTRREWSWTKYDATERIVLSGLTSRADTLGQVSLQALAAADTASSHQYEQRTADRATYPQGMTTDQSFPHLGQQGFAAGQVLSVTRYDDYDFDNDGLPDAAYDPSQNGQFPAGTAPVADVLRTTGMVTQTRTRVLGVADNDATQAAWLTTTTFYDERARPVQMQTSNARKDTSGQQGRDVLTTRLDFTGKVMQSVAAHQGPNLPQPLLVQEFFTYDHTGRLLTTRQQLPGEARPARLDSVSYNEVGQAVGKTLGTGRLQQQVDYTYNIRGWLTRLNDPYFPVKEDLFNMSLHYETGFTAGYEQYNGNLTGQTWRGRDGVQRAYGYVYDPLNRLLQGDFVARQTTTAATSGAGAWQAEEDNYRLSFVSYDDNGNILTLRRRGLLQNATHATSKQYGAVDNLTYAYQGNRLQAVDDAVTGNQLLRPATYHGAPTSLAGDFQEQGVKLGQEYRYDANGNLTQDQNKGITGILYNHLNLPRQIHFGQVGDSVVFRYAASGQKVAKLVYQTGKATPLRTDYLGPYQYEQDSLKFFPHAEGRVLRFVSTDAAHQPTVSYHREFTLKDHLGNLRLAYRAGQTRTYLATLEQDATTRQRETQQFDSLSVSLPIAVATPWAMGQYAARLNAGGSTPQPLGPLTQFTVQRGDSLRISAPGLYPQKVTSSSFAFSLASFVAGLLQPAPVGAPPRADGSRRGGLPLLQVGLNAAALTAVSQLSNGVPKGYLRVLVFTQDSVLVDQRKLQLTQDALGHYQVLRDTLSIRRDGYVTVYVGNESPVDVYFDELRIEHHQGLQVQETQYDPAGLELAGLVVPSPGIRGLNNYRFNGKEFQADLGLAWNHQDWRFFDPQLLRWNGVDPLLEAGQESWSPYSFGFDNPVRFEDANGLAPTDTYNIYADGMINVIKNNDKTDTFNVHNQAGEQTESYTMSKHTANDGTSLVEFPTNGNSWVKSLPNQDNFIHPNEAAAIIGASSNYKETTGNKIQINQLTDNSEKHSKHSAKGGMADIRYANKNGGALEVVYTGTQRFDKERSQLLANEFNRFGFNKDLSILTENGSGNGPALSNTHYADPHYLNGVHYIKPQFTHQHHMHLQYFNQSVVTPVSNPAAYPLITPHINPPPSLLKLSYSL